MQWQDWVFSVGNWILAASLVPSIRGKNKPELSTSFPTAVILYVFSFTFTTLSLWVTSASLAISASLWAILAYQRFRQPKK